jgi:hypothetical protein
MMSVVDGCALGAVALEVLSIVAGSYQQVQVGLRSRHHIASFTVKHRHRCVNQRLCCWLSSRRNFIVLKM